MHCPRPRLFRRDLGWSTERHPSRAFKNGKGRMAIIQFEDLTGSTEVIAMGDDFDRYEELLTSDEPLLLRGRLRIDRDEDQTKISIRLGVGRNRKKAPIEDDGPDVLLLKDVRATVERRHDFYQEPATQRPGLPISAGRSQTP